jgi:hypothetical protein
MEYGRNPAIKILHSAIRHIPISAVKLGYSIIDVSMIERNVATLPNRVGIKSLFLFPYPLF